MTGEWPPEHIDHKDRVCANNKWSNLRAAMVFQNMANRGPSRRNQSGKSGVNWHAARGKWRASIRFDGQYIYLGSFLSKAEAIAARDAAGKVLLGEFYAADCRLG
jgi:hypothetical protein